MCRLGWIAWHFINRRLDEPFWIRARDNVTYLATTLIMWWAWIFFCVPRTLSSTSSVSVFHSLTRRHIPGPRETSRLGIMSRLETGYKKRNLRRSRRMWRLGTTTWHISYFCPAVVCVTTREFRFFFALLLIAVCNLQNRWSAKTVQGALLENIKESSAAVRAATAHLERRF